MKNALTFLTLLVLRFAMGQHIPANQDSDKAVQDQLYSLANLEEKPEFPGGPHAFDSFVKTNFSYPSGLSAKGKVYASFVIKKDGSLTDVKVFRGLRPEIDAEVIRVLKSSPYWKPGMQRGNVVRTLYHFPVSIAPASSPTKTDRK